MSAALRIQEIRASSLASIMQCSGPVILENLLPNTGNDAAREGTAAGELFQAMLEQRTLTPSVPLVATNGVRFNEDMYFYLKPHVMDILNKSGRYPILCETRIDFRSQSGITLRGQYDVSWYDLETMTLHVYDLKFGFGIVDVKENWQLLAYAIGESIRLNRTHGLYVNQVVFEIHQPRAYHEEGTIRRWTISSQELHLYWTKIEERFHALAEGDKELRTGSKCKYCRAAPVCPALNNATHSALDVVMNDWVQDDMSNEVLSKQLEILERAEELIKIRLDSLTQLGVLRVNKGEVIPGRGLKQTYGHRRWKPNVTPESFKMLTGVDIRETTIMSPAKVEQLGVTKEFVDVLTERPISKTKLAPMDLTAKAQEVFGKKG